LWRISQAVRRSLRPFVAPLGEALARSAQSSGGPGGAIPIRRIVAAEVEEERVVRVLVGYESVLGHTRLVAEAVAAGLRRSPPPGAPSRVECAQVGWLSADVPADVDLLVLGAPTHFLGLPGDRTRQLWVRGVVEASRRGPHRHLEPGSTGPGLREFLADLPDAVPVEADVPDRSGPDRAARPVRVPLAAAFDTRLARPFAPGAARSIARCLRRHGYRLVAPPEGFLVTEIEGPLRAGELERAELWGEALADRFAATVAS
jgi:hypothetical protein